MRRFGILVLVTGLASSLLGNVWAEECPVGVNAVCQGSEEPTPENGSPDGNPPSQGEPAPAPASPSPQELAAQLLAKSNAERAAAGLGTLKTNAWAKSVSQGHSDAMAAAKNIWHNMDYFAKGRKAMGAKQLGENVVMASTIDKAHSALMNSPGHRANILEPKFNFVGFTVSIDDAGYLYATQNFAYIPEAAAAPAKPAAPVRARAAKPAPAAPVAAVPAPPVQEVVKVLSGTTTSRKPVREEAPSRSQDQGSQKALLAAIDGLLLLAVGLGLMKVIGMRPSTSRLA